MRFMANISLLVLIVVFTTTDAFSWSKERSCINFSGKRIKCSKKRVLRRKFKTKKSQLSMSADVATSVTMDEKCDFSQHYGITSSYTFNKNAISANISAEKHFVKTVGLNQEDFYLNAPWIRYSRLAILKNGSWSLDSLFAKMAATSKELYKDTSKYSSFTIGGTHSFSLLKNLNFSHTLFGTKNFNKYENGQIGVYSSHAIINNLALNFSPTKKISLSAYYTIIDTFSYSGARGSNRSSGISATYNFLKGWNTTLGLDSGADYMRYESDTIEFYNMDNLKMTLSIVKVFK